MRRRRLERCVLRAQVALEAGFVDDARAALEEARELDPSTDLADLERSLESVSAEPLPLPLNYTPEPELPLRQAPIGASAAELPRPRVRFNVPAVAASLILLAMASTLWRGAEPVDSSGTAPAQAAAADPEPPAPRRAPAVSVREEIVPAAETHMAALEPPAPQPPDLPVRPESERATRESQSEPEPERRTPPVVTASAAPPEPELPARPEPSSPPPPSLAANVGALELPAASMPVKPPAVVPTAGTGEPPPPARTASLDTTPKVDEAERVREVLSRYEAAYSGLDAAAARAVWPSVDQRALARAFKGLESQRLSLEPAQCQVSVSGTSAKAECAGSASWTQKVGGTERSQSGQWIFDLRNASGDWQIVRAVVR